MVQCVVLHKLFQHTVFVVGRRSIILCIYLFAEVLVEGSFFDIGIAFIADLTIALGAADHIVHAALIGKLIIVCESKISSHRLPLAHRKGQRHHLLTAAVMPPYEYLCLMLHSEEVSAKHQIISDGVEQQQWY